MMRAAPTSITTDSARASLVRTTFTIATDFDVFASTRRRNRLDHQRNVEGAYDSPAANSSTVLPLAFHAAIRVDHVASVLVIHARMRRRDGYEKDAASCTAYENALAARGIVRDSSGQWVYVAEAVPDATPEQARVAGQQVEFLNRAEARQQHEMHGRMRSQWVESLLEYVDVINRDGTHVRAADVALFGIRLHGLIGEMHAERRAWFNRIDVDPITRAVVPSSLLGRTLVAFRLTEAVRTRLTEDELIYADYRRLVDCHPTQASYDVRWSVAGSRVADRRAVPSIGREFTVDELSTACVRVLRGHANEHAVAIGFTGRIRNDLFALVEATRVGAAIV